jgi:LCP family protein required for cell wall assembly
MPPRRPPKKRSLIGKFFKTFFIALCAFVVCSGVVIFGYSMLASDDPIRIAIKTAIDSNLKGAGSFGDLFSSIPEHTNFVILGMDDSGTRTDVMIVGTFNSKTKDVSLISIPRDTYVTMPPERRDVLWNEWELWTPDDGGMKLTEVHHYAGKEYGVEFAVKQIEDLLDIQIPYYVKIDLDAFQFIVDELGGIEFDVPEYMDYDDPYQDLHIHLSPGVQTLSGEDAMGLVRYRSYGRGDWQRIETQQNFIKAVVAQVLSKDRMLSNAKPVIETIYNYVETNLQITDAFKYLPFAADVDVDNIQSYTLPGEDGRVGGKSVVINDAAGTAEIVDEVFYNFDNQGQDASAETSEDKKIQVLNGTYTSGLAAKNQEYLEENGFMVDDISDYTGTKADYTRVYVRKKGYGEDIKALYPGSKLIVDKTMVKNYDIIVVLGTNEE